jgi:putative protease
VILARETPLSEIEKITPILETEVFVQGALCTAYSGQCYFSSFIGGNSGNRGRCKQPCRKKYYYNRGQGQEFCYALSLSDLSVGEEIQKLIDESYNRESLDNWFEISEGLFKYREQFQNGEIDIDRTV